MTDWDGRFIELAKLVSTWSKDPSTQVGAILVSPDRHDVILGYNGFPRGIVDNDRLELRATKYQLMIHAEMNVLLNARRSVVGYTLYTYPLMPCARCATSVIQAGVARVVAPALFGDRSGRWAIDVHDAERLFSEAGVDWLEVT